MTGLPIPPASTSDIGRALPTEAVDRHGHSHLHQGLAAAVSLRRWTWAPDRGGKAVVTAATALDAFPSRALATAVMCGTENGCDTWRPLQAGAPSVSGAERERLP